MHAYKGSLTRFCIFSLVLAFSLCLIPKQAAAFDTGHHTDLTRNALLREGFGPTAADVVVLENWVTDFYGNFLTFKLAAGGSPIALDIDPRVAAEIVRLKTEFEKLHFDNLFDIDRVRAYWARFVFNTFAALSAELLKPSPDPVAVLTMLGITLHAVQDFYSHSNWVEQFGSLNGPFETKTWFDADETRDAQKLKQIHTGWFSTELFPQKPSNAQSHDKLNKDNYQIPNWDQAYVFAYAASRQWIHQFSEWVEALKPGFWQQVRDFTSCELDELHQELEISRRISSWIPNPPINGGHWKGDGSARISRFFQAVSQWGSSKSPFKTEFTDKAPLYHLGQRLYEELVPTLPAPRIQPYPLNEVAVIIRTKDLKNKNPAMVLSPSNLIPISSGANFYARITVTEEGQNGFAQEFFEATQQNNNGSSNWPWYTIKMVPASALRIRVKYELFDEQEPSDQVVDINPSIGKSDLDFSFFLVSKLCEGDITGLHDSENNMATPEGDGIERRTAKISFYISKRGLR